MDADTMRERHTAAVTRYARQLADDAQIPAGLLAELRDIAQCHATDILCSRTPAAAEAAGATESDSGTMAGQSPQPVPERPAAARRTPARGSRSRTR